MTPESPALRSAAEKYAESHDRECKWLQCPMRLASGESFLAGAAYAFEEAAKLCEGNAEGYRTLQVRAREDHDIQGALAHLCEKDASLLCAREIRALASNGEAR